MKEDVKDILFLFGIALLLWLLSVAIVNPIMVWLLKWVFKIGAVLFIIGGIITVINAVVSRRSRNKNKEENNESNT